MRPTATVDRADRTQHALVQPAKRQIEYARPWMAGYQLDAIFHEDRFGFVEASTKAGKTTGCLIWLLEQALITGAPGRNYWWVAPVFAQADIAYERMKRAIPRDLFRPHEGEHTITMINGAVIMFKGADRPDTLYGEDVYAAVIDEASRMKMDVWLAVRSTLTFTRGPVRVIGNVRGRKNWAFKMGRKAETDPVPGVRRFRRISAYDAVAAGILAEDEIKQAKEDLTAEDFNELYLAVAPKDEGQIYHSFDPDNVVEKVRDAGGDIHIGMDFNVDPMTATVSSKVGDELHTWDEIYMRNSDTEKMALKIRQRWPNRSIIVHPDPSGKRRSTSGRGTTDFTILKEHRFRINAPRAAPPVADRINEVNRLLCNANGRRRNLIHPRCKRLIAALDEHEYKEGTNVPDKTTGHDHITDAHGYKVHNLFPIVQKRTGTRELDF